MNEITKLILGTVIRHFLTALAALLATYGVTKEQQESFVESVLPVAVSVIIGLISLAWAIAQKRYSQGLVEAAHQSPPTVPIEIVKEEIKTTGVQY
jgi:hypothetical protein